VLQNVLTIVFAGAVGKHLQPLTEDRAKAAVPFGGKYRLIDFSLTNCLHSGLRRILVLTQYKSHSLHKHLRDGWSVFNPELGEYITAVPPQMRTGDVWYRGTADALYQNLYLLERSGAESVLLLQGDHVYRMDYEPVIRAHKESGAEVTVICREVGKENSNHTNVVAFDSRLRITDIKQLSAVADAVDSEETPRQSSMGVYVFSVEALIRVLKHAISQAEATGRVVDFGAEIIASMVENNTAYAYLFGAEAGRVSQDKYWRDITTLDEYYAANMDLLKPVPSIDLYQQDWPVRTYSGQHPPARNSPGKMGNEGISVNSIAATGSVICGGKVQGSILFNDVFIEEEAIIESSLLFDGVRVGEGALLRNCIIEKGVTVPEGEVIGHDPRMDKERFMLTEGGLVVIPKGFVFS
jgi:glucose-1-phosphate adenylyltransferase